MDFGLDPELTAQIVKARRNIGGAKAMTATTNIADVKYLTESSLDYLLNTPEALRKVEIEDTFGAIDSFRARGLATSRAPADTRGIIGYDESLGSYVFKSRDISEPIPLSQDTAETYLRSEIRSTRQKNLSIEDAKLDTSPRSSVIMSTGINPVQMTNTHDLRELLSSGSASPIRVGEGVDPSMISTLIKDNEEVFLDGITATNSQLGYSEGAAAHMSGSGIPIRHPLQSIGQTISKDYNSLLNSAGITAASMNPAARSAVVSMSAATSQVGATNFGLIKGALAFERDATGALIERSADYVGQDLLTGAVGANRENISRIMPLLSDLGIVHTKTQKVLSITDSVVSIPFKLIEKMKTLDKSGQEISMVQALRQQKVRLSVATRSADLTPTVNVIFGGSIGDKMPTANAIAAARKQAETLFDAVMSMKELKTPEAMIQAGYAQSEEAALDNIKKFSGFDLSKREEMIAKFTDKMATRGVNIGGLSEQLRRYWRRSSKSCWHN